MVPSNQEMSMNDYSARAVVMRGERIEELTAKNAALLGRALVAEARAEMAEEENARLRARIAELEANTPEARARKALGDPRQGVNLATTRALGS
jgi:hypothetical protein